MPEAELQAAAKVNGGIPLELWDTPRREVRQHGQALEARAITATPSLVSQNLDPVYPQIFAHSIAPRLGIEMPEVDSGTYATATIATSVGGDAKAKGAAAVATAATFRTASATPKRVSSRLELAIEDIAAVGPANFESALRENASLALSDALDMQVVSGNGTAPNLTGILQRLTDPSGSGSRLLPASMISLQLSPVVLTACGLAWLTRLESWSTRRRIDSPSRPSGTPPARTWAI